MGRGILETLMSGPQKELGRVTSVHGTCGFSLVLRGTLMGSLKTCIPGAIHLGLDLK